MKLEPNQLYHVFNQGNDRQRIFFNDDDYRFFLKKARNHIIPEADLLAYCLMPNHFHFLVYTSERSCEVFTSGNIEVQKLTSAFRVQLSSYTNFVNKRDKRSGSLFRQRTKYKPLTSVAKSANLGLICFHYIHQNPLKARLVKRMEDWEFSSFKDYAGLRDDTICNYQLAANVLDIRKETFVQESYGIIRDDLRKRIF